MRAEVIIRPSGQMPRVTRIVGVIDGPRRGRDTTLPVTARLESVSESSGRAAARAILTEPAYWTPESPNLYRLQGRLETPDLSPCDIDMLIGLRRLGVRGRSFWLDGRRWVSRAAIGLDDIEAAKRASVGVMLTAPCESMLARADALGVAIVSLLDASDVTDSRIAALARHPSVLMAIVVDSARSGSLASDVAVVRNVKGTMQMGIAVDAALPDSSLADAFDFVTVMLPADGLPAATWRDPQGRPLVAWRRGACSEASAARKSCEVLQRDLAAWGLAPGGDRMPWDWAGYLVG